MRFIAKKNFYDARTKQQYNAGDVVPWDDGRGLHYAEQGLVDIGDPIEERPLPTNPIEEDPITPDPNPKPPRDGINPPTPTATPKAKELARNLGVDLLSLAGTGTDGKITVKDVKKHGN